MRPAACAVPFACLAMPPGVPVVADGCIHDLMSGSFHDAGLNIVAF